MYIETRAPVPGYGFQTSGQGSFRPGPRETLHPSVFLSGRSTAAACRGTVASQRTLD